ncbi:hypothetical protein K470DRAFT_260399 [Piedraia hortae CBS 480.64]|uniref:Uncharacterized protein n=1 Tax=Piedraia hortae CBS 480.64 TaxID=1314780 RepID=A0A6A7BSG2_9PEZI|nr:hypothetical protein K470DRAFT_260399 [Piedraia hortae CBS 480.64]
MTKAPLRPQASHTQRNNFLSPSPKPHKHCECTPCEQIGAKRLMSSQSMPFGLYQDDNRPLSPQTAEKQHKNLLHQHHSSTSILAQIATSSRKMTQRSPHSEKD